MRKPRLSIEVTGTLGAADYRWKITHNGKQLAESEPIYATADLADEAAEYAKVKLQEAMMATSTAGNPASPPAVNFKVRKPRKVKDNIASTKFPEACAFLEKAVTLIGAVSIKEAGEHIERLNKAMETIENVRKDLSEIE